MMTPNQIKLASVKTTTIVTPQHWRMQLLPHQSYLRIAFTTIGATPLYSNGTQAKKHNTVVSECEQTLANLVEAVLACRAYAAGAHAKRKVTSAFCRKDTKNADPHCQETLGVEARMGQVIFYHDDGIGGVAGRARGQCRRHGTHQIHRRCTVGARRTAIAAA